MTKFLVTDTLIGRRQQTNSGAYSGLKLPRTGFLRITSISQIQKESVLQSLVRHSMKLKKNAPRTKNAGMNMTDLKS